MTEWKALLRASWMACRLPNDVVCWMVGDGDRGEAGDEGDRGETGELTPDPTMLPLRLSSLKTKSLP